ncbi:MAG: hypothetical protein AMXMBFR13_20630 [Phycisphaerae bacterium]
MSVARHSFDRPKTNFAVSQALSRRALLRTAGAAAASWVVGQPAFAQSQPAGTIMDFEEKLSALRVANYRHRKTDLKTGFRPVGGMVADFAVAQRDGRYHFFYIERRLQEGTPFYPGHEIYFGHASTADFLAWEVHDPVLLIRPGTWENGHVCAPYIIQRGDEYLMAYTGVNHLISQNIGLASSKDLFEWRRWESNPISPCRNASWAYWREDGIASCRDPHLTEHDGRIWMIYSAATKEGAACVAMTSTADLKTWRDHGPIVTGPASGYEPRMTGGHPQGSLESPNLQRRNGRWYLTVKAAIRDSRVRNWVFTSDRMDRFDWNARSEFWRGALGVEVLKNKGDRSLMATFTGGHIRLGVADWSGDSPSARFLTDEAELREWLA